MTHTPGPWNVDNRYVVGPISTEDDQSYGMVIGVADVYGPNRINDAHLIASAPDLLVALKKILEGNTMKGKEQFTHADVIQKHYQIARNAIAKAEGRTV